MPFQPFNASEINLHVPSFIASPSAAARRTAPSALSGRLPRADKRAHEFSIHQRADGFGVDAFVRQERERVFQAVDPSRFDIDRFETGGGESGPVIVLIESA